MTLAIVEEHRALAESARPQLADRGGLAAATAAFDLVSGDTTGLTRR